MKRPLVSLLALVLALSLATVSCTQAAPPPAPTSAPAAPKAAEPTKAPAAAPATPTKAPAASPTAVPAKKSDFPVKGKPIQIIVPFAAGGPNDLAARILAPMWEKELGVPVEVMNKPGASTQVGVSEMVKAKPDGHTLAYTSIPTSLVYLDPERKATYGSQDLAVIAQHIREAGSLSVRADSQFKTLKDLLDYAKANPGKLKAADNGILAVNHINLLMTQRAAGVKFSAVHFDGTAPELTALLGGHVDLMFTAINPQTVGPHKSGQIRVLGVMDSVPSKQLPDVPTFESQGCKVYSYTSYGLWGQSGLPADIVATLDGLVKKAANDPDHVQKMAEAGMTVNYLGSKEWTTFWREWEALFKEFVELAKEEQK